MYVNANLEEINLSTYHQIDENGKKLTFSFPKDFEAAEVGNDTIYLVLPERVGPGETEIGEDDGFELFEGKVYRKLAIRDKTPEELQADLIPYLSNYRYQREIGGFLFNGMFIPTDEKTERRIIGARVKAEADPDYVIPDWTTDQGATVHTLDAATIIAISNAFDAHVQKCFSAMVAVRANIAEYTRRAEIEAAFEVAYGS